MEASVHAGPFDSSGKVKWNALDSVASGTPSGTTADFEVCAKYVHKFFTFCKADSSDDNFCLSLPLI